MKKGHDSEDADRRDSMTRPTFSSFCHASEKLYKKPIFFLAKRQDPETCNFKTKHMLNVYLKFSKSESISVRIQKNGKDAQRKSVQEELKMSQNGRSWFHFKPKPIWY